MVRRGYSVLLVCILLIGAVGAARAQVDPEMQTIELTLDQCLRAALDNNLSLVSARKDPAVSEQNVVAEDAAYDYGTFAEVDHSELQQELSNLFSLNSRTSDSLSIGYDKSLRFGGNYTISLDMSNSDASGPLVTTPSSYDAQLAMSLNLPMLRGFGKQFQTLNLELARGNLEISREQLRGTAEGTMKSVEDAYWDLVAAREALRIAELSRQRAKDLLDLNRKKVEVGTLAPIEITQAEAGVASEEEGVIVARTTLINAEDELRRLMAVEESSPLWEMRLVPTTDPVSEEVTVDLADSLETALAERPELNQAHRTVRNRLLSERVARNGKMPGLDLVAQVRPSGNNFETIIGVGPDMIPGTPDDTSTTFTSGQIGTALSEVPDFVNYDWSLGLRFSYTIGNRAAKANYAIATINREQAEVNLADQEQSIRVDVRRAVREVRSGIQRVEAARANQRLQQEKLDAERKKFDNGMSTSFEVLTFQNDLADAELATVRAMLDYNKALSGLELAKGTLLAARGLSIAN